MKKSNNITTFEEHLSKQYGKKGTYNRDKFEAKAKAYTIGALLKDERLHAKLTQKNLLIK